MATNVTLYAVEGNPPELRAFECKETEKRIAVPHSAVHFTGYRRQIDKNRLGRLHRTASEAISAYLINADEEVRRLERLLESARKSQSAAVAAFPSGVEAE